MIWKLFLTFQNDQWGGDLLSGAGENTGIVPGVLCDGALDAEDGHDGVTGPVGVDPEGNTVSQSVRNLALNELREGFENISSVT